MLVSRVEYDTSCGSIGAPCLSVFDSRARMTSVSGACELVSSSPIYGDTAVCSVPTDVVANLGDRDDAYWGWSGPNTVDAGAGNDNPITGAGGDDSLHGGIGSDELEGWDGDDLLDGGPGDDYLEGIAYVEEGMTHGTDTYVGGGGYDTVTYEGRTEDLSLSPDGVANDGAAGERDDIGTDVMADRRRPRRGHHDRQRRPQRLRRRGGRRRARRRRRRRPPRRRARAPTG